jgi:hypothetical protein
MMSLGCSPTTSMNTFIYKIFILYIIHGLYVKQKIIRMGWLK